ncbi:MAG TPA: molybdopterin cofactor-binding domain-containing protein [Vicinamibacterales bacterium]|nr:molybdopterin cofactor-binding domain-containing protein [Vicinamibacterales bacterium]
MTQDHEPELERYELSESRRYLFELPDVDRRDFLRILTAMGGGLLVVATLPDAEAQESGRATQNRPAPGDLASWIHIGADGRITAYTGKVEIGQNIRTSLSQVIADELRAPLATIAFVMADTDLTPFDQGTFGSRTTPAMAPQLARAAAAAREMLIDLAAAQLQVDRTTLKADAGRVVASNGRAAGYGELTRGKQLTGVVGADVRVAPPDQWVARGTAVRKVNGRDIVTGRHAFTPDLERPGMLMGRVIRPDALGAEPVSVDDTRAKAMPGVTVVRDGNFIGVVAPDERALRQAAAAVSVTWSVPPGQPTSETIFEHLKQAPASAAGGGGRGSAPTVRGDVTSARAAAAKVFEASYKIPYIAHVPLEPRAAVAEWQDGKVTVWTGTQRPFGVRSEVAEALRLPEDRVRVIVPDMGSGYGGKHTGEQAIEAARLAKAAERPVKLVYTRAEEFMWAYFRPAGVIDVVAGVGPDGRLVSWEFDNWNSGTAGLQTPYSVPNQRVAFHGSASPLRQGSYRGLAATANHYAREMHMDAVARGLGVDQLEFRLKHITDARLRAVLTTAAQKSGWPRAATAGAALGIACGLEKGGYVATAAEVVRDTSSQGGGPARHPQGFRIQRLTVVFECGAIVNPDGLKNQVEGAIVQGLGGALFEAVTFAGGKILNGTMAQYRVPRFKDVPPIEIILLNRTDLPSAGAGETPIVCVAPAIGSAVRAFGTVPEALPVALTGLRS